MMSSEIAITPQNDLWMESGIIVFDTAEDKVYFNTDRGRLAGTLVLTKSVKGGIILYTAGIGSEARMKAGTVSGCKSFVSCLHSLGILPRDRMIYGGIWPGLWM